VTFDACAYLAGQLGCDKRALMLLDGPTSRADRSQSATYARLPSTLKAGQVTIGPRRRNIAGVVRRLVTVTWGSGGKGQRDIGPYEAVRW
jgi:hypothetical protein